MHEADGTELTRARTPSWWTVAALVACTGTILVALERGLPPNTFYSGDSGVKLIAALDASAHPWRPFESDLPRVGDTTLPFADTMMVTHGDHAHALQSPLFPPLSAPFIAAFGLRGAYALPALGFLALLPILESIRRRALPAVSFWILAWLTIAAGPLLFYALEFWEHTLAVALVAGAFAASLSAGERGRGAAISGALAALAMLLRPEAVWAAAGIALTLPARRWVAFGAGGAAVVLPFAAANLAHSGNPLGTHAAATLVPLRDYFWSGRWPRLYAWLVPRTALDAAGLALIAGAWVARPLITDIRIRQCAGLLGAALVGVAAAQRDILPQESLWQGFPAATLAFLPVAVSEGARKPALVAAVAIAGVLLTSSHDGGAQWGARYLLIAAPALLLLAAHATTVATARGRWHAARLALVAVILVSGALTSRAGYLELRSAKRNYAGIVQATASYVPPGQVILTNLWWFDQVAASLHDTRVFAYAADREAATQALATLTRTGHDQVTLVWSADPAEGPSLADIVGGTCFAIRDIRVVRERQLRLAAARCARD